MTDLILLLGDPLFQGLDRAAAAAVDRGERRCYPKGETVFDPANFFPALGLVLSGALEVRRGQMRMDDLGPGSLFGAAALFDGRGRYPTTITATEDTEVLFLSRELMEELMTRYPPLALRYIRYLSGRISFLSDRVDALGAGGGADKLLCYLRDQGGRIERLSGETLAASLGMSRATLYRALDALMAKELIVKEGKTISLKTK